MADHRRVPRTPPPALKSLPDALVDGDLRLSSVALDERIAAKAAELQEQGVEPGDVVSWQLPNRWEAVALYHACWQVGAAAAPVHHLAGPAEVDALLEMVRPKVTVTLRSVGDFGRQVAEITHRTRFGGAAREDVAVILFTSGSSGEPKGVMHTRRALAYKAELMAQVHGLTPGDAILMPAPLAHVSGLLNGVLLPAVVPMKAVLMARWDPEVALDIVERERITFMIGPPTFFVGLMGAAGFSTSRVESLRLVSCGGAGVTAAFVEDASERLGCVVKRTYGSTEAPTVTTAHEGDDPVLAGTTDGRPTGAVEVRIGDGGEIQLRGPELFVGYTDPTATAEAFTADGWFRTGDRGTLSEDGWLTVTGRIKDVVIRAGENIAVAEVESVLEAHPQVAHAVVVGEPDERLGERVAAFVVLRTGGGFGVEECRAWFESRGVARHKTPERIVVLDSMPTLAAGKPDRAALRALL